MVNEGRENNANWDAIWDVATRIVEPGWYAEIRIPFRTLRFSDGEVWGLNFERKLRRLNEDSYWAPLPRIYDLQRSRADAPCNCRCLARWLSPEQPEGPLSSTAAEGQAAFSHPAPPGVELT